MQQIFLALIDQLNAAVAILVLLSVIAFIAVYRIGGIVTLFTTFKEGNKETKDDIKAIREEVTKVKATTDLLYQSHLKTLQTHSPLGLSEIGKEAAIAISANNIVQNHWEKIKEKINEKNPKNPYDIQVVSLEISRDCFDSLFTDEEKNKVKEYAFNTGMNLLHLYPVIGIVIRDRILQERGMKVDEIDNHDPNKKTP